MLAYRLFGRWVRKNKKYWESLHKDLKAAGLKYSIEEYVSNMLFYTIISFLISFILSFFVLYYMFSIKIIVFPIFLSTFISSLVLIGFYLYPSNLKESRKRKIENSIHYAALYMATLANTGIPPYLIFKTLSNFKEFTEISKICEKIVRDIELFGLDFVDAVTKAAEEAPSNKLRELLIGIKATVTTGGDLSRFLYEKARSFIQDYKRRLEEYLQLLSVLTEVYITVVVVGSIFAIVITSIMGAMGGIGGIKEIQLLLVVLGLPVLSSMFILILKALSPLET